MIFEEKHSLQSIFFFQLLTDTLWILTDDQD
jgi:hypothetical protein